ncbi:disease resistance protein RPS2-like [Dioscorea cayenensis subsp. rotundata]|uniref:Disease resistance protein RPS2-like n=1 Tax=Dioscorea cayennensis subsp. rotundata TaxID=55577 RepID=A0AB40BTR8_DIOCR|nr:disease resistance protein RPS2-like [Dioscorea cayenensis subsp. rotundata]
MVVFTTCTEKVCAFMEANKKIKMECLGPDVSWLLFKEKAGEEFIASDNLIQQHAKDIVRECAGLPLTLVTVEKAMRTKMTAQEWEYVASMVRKSKYQSIPDTNDLIECWMGHGLLDDFDDLNEAYNKGGIIIGNLKEACLLESVAPSSWYDEYKSYVKLHDVIRDLALWITSDCGRTSKDDFTSISISPSQLGSNSMTNLHEFEISNIESLQELVMTTEGDSSCCLSHLIKLSLQYLPHLKNVIWKDLETHFFLPGLVYLQISGCNSLTNLRWTAHLPRLKELRIWGCDKLEIITKACDDATKVNEEEGNLFKSLKFLDLRGNPNLECIYKGELSLPSIETVILIGRDKLRKLPLGFVSAKNLKTIKVSSVIWDNMDWAHKDHFSHLAHFI